MGLSHLTHPMNTHEPKGLVKKARCLTRPARARQDVPFLWHKAAGLLARGAYTEYVSTIMGRPTCAKPLRRRQGTPLADPTPLRGHAFSTAPRK
ncbi:MAG: hypothetical protein V3U07_02535 [Nitrospirales bacterium]